LVVTQDARSFTVDPLTTPMKETDSTDIYILIRNIGRGSAWNVMVRVYDHETPIWMTNIERIDGNGGSAVVKFTWRPVEGASILRFAADPENSIMELDENNNHYTMPEVNVGPKPAEPPAEKETASWMSILPYIIIPLILVLLIVLLLRRKKAVNVTVLEAKATAKVGDAPQKWVYTCGVGEKVIGKTKPTAVKALKGTAIRVAITDINIEEDGTMTWWNPEVLGVADAEDREDKILKMAKKKE
ncbi:MAG: CARDB domain-containing protein, partial [Thermoplasmata archaeon]